MIIILAVLAALACLVLVAMLATILINARAFPRLRVPPAAAPPLIHPSADTPLVSVLVSVSNQANTVASLVQALRAQTYTPFEVVILDAGSTDGTRAIAEAATKGDPRFRVVAGQPLLQTWNVRNWNRHQLSQAANGRVLLFVDSGLVWMPGALRALVAMMQGSQADLLTVWPRLLTGTRAERLLVPLAALALWGGLPVSLAHRGQFPALAVANGQCLAFRRSAYTAVGGHIAVRGSEADGVDLARRVQAKGLRLRHAESGGLLVSRPYRGWVDVRARLAADARKLSGGSAAPLLAFTMLCLLGVVFPWGWLLLGWLSPETAGWPWVPLALVLLGLGVSAAGAWVARFPRMGVFWTPVSSLLMLAILVKGLLGRHIDVVSNR